MTELLVPSNHVTIRLVVFSQGPLRGELTTAIEAFGIPGVYAEGVSQFGMLALDIDATADLDTIVSVLRSGSSSDWWEYEEGRVTDSWGAATATDSDAVSPRGPDHAARLRPTVPR